MVRHRSRKKATRFSLSNYRLPKFALVGSQHRRWLRGILLLTVAIYLLGFGSVPVSNNDGQLMLTSGMIIYKTGKLIAPSRFSDKKLGGRLFGRESTEGEVFPKYPPGYPLALALFMPIAGIMGKFLGGVAADIVLCLPSMLAILISMFLIWRASLRLGYHPTSASCLIVGLGLGSYLWPYGGLNWSEPLQILCITATFYCLLAAWQEEAHWKPYTFLGGSSLAFAILTKSSLGILAPILVLGSLAVWRERFGFKTAWFRASVYAVPGVIASVFILAVNFLLTGDPGNFGYAGESFSTPIIEALPVMTLSLHRGIIWFAPLVILAPYGAFKLFERGNRWPAAILTTSIVAHFALIFSWYGYTGGNCWGPRLLLPVLPYLILLAGATIDASWSRRLGWSLVGLGIAVNALGVLVNYQAFYSIFYGSMTKVENASRRGKQPPSQISGHLWLSRIGADTLIYGRDELDQPLWEKPPWLEDFPKAVPDPYYDASRPIINPWPLRLLLPEGKWKRDEKWYLRLLLEVAIIKYQNAELDRSLAILDEGLAIDSEYKQFVAAKGMVLFSMGDIRNALHYYNRSLTLDPDYDLGLYGKGLIMEMLGNHDEARRIYVKLLSLEDLSLNKEEIEARLTIVSERN